MSLLPGGFFGGGGGGGAPAYEIEKSLRFRASASARLQRTFGTPTSTTIWTYSTWVKRGALTGTFRLFGASTNTFLTFNASDQINLTLNGTSAATSTAVFRDPSAHYHIVYQQNGSTQTIWVNNVSVATGTTAAAVFNTAIAHQIGAANTSNFFDGYQSEIIFIDGQALTPSSFGEFDSNGVWVPKAYNGTYGNNGFYLPFSNGTSLSTLTADASGNGNNWTANNISLTAGATYDWMDDTPTNNFAVLNPLNRVNTAVPETAANLSFSIGNVIWGLQSSIPLTGKIYWEVAITTKGTNDSQQCGIFRSDHNMIVSWLWSIAGNRLFVDGVASGISMPQVVAGDLISFTCDTAIKQCVVRLNNSVVATVTYTSNAVPYAAVLNSFTNGGWTGSINFGQRPFAYTPPTGFLPLCTKNIGTIAPISSGSFTGNANANGPFVWLAGTPDSMTINGNAVTWGTHADRLANGFKVRTSSASYNAAGTNTFSVSSFVDEFDDPNRAKGNP